MIPAELPAGEYRERYPRPKAALRLLTTGEFSGFRPKPAILSAGHFLPPVGILAGQFPNLYFGMSWTQHTIKWRPRFFSKLFGQAMLWCTADKIIWGCDGEPDAESIECFKKFQFTDELQESYGFKPITEEDKAKIFGLNLAKLLDIEPKKRDKVFDTNSGKKLR